MSAMGAGYSWFVRTAKIALPLLALGVVAVVVTRLSQDPQLAQLVELPTKEKTAAGQMQLVNAKYEGVDTKGRPFTLLAASATREANAAETVLLDKPRADITLEDGAHLSVKAERGRFDNQAGRLFLGDNVTVLHDGGYEVYMRDVSVDLNARNAATTQPVRAAGPAGTLSAQNVAVISQGDLVVFGGPALLVLKQSRPVLLKPPVKKVPG